eukprot:3237682-Pleurochrysis_carterae.AAC.3
MSFSHLSPFPPCSSVITCTCCTDGGDGGRQSAQVIFTEDNTALVITSRELASSEEVSISYVPTSLPVVERRAQLRARYGFDCHCATCTSELGRGRSKAQMSEARATGTKREGPHHEGHTGRVKGCGA